MHDFLKKANKGEPLLASSWNRLVKKIESLNFVNSPTITWDRTTNGYIANVRGTSSTANSFKHPYKVSNASTYDAQTDTWDIKLKVGKGSRRVIGGIWRHDGFDTDIEIPANYSSRVAHIVLVWIYGQGWMDWANVNFKCITETDLFTNTTYTGYTSDNPQITEGTNYHIEYIADVSFNAEGRVDSIWQRVFQDIQFYDFGGCASPAEIE
jgi:hypothetical protein